MTKLNVKAVQANLSENGNPQYAKDAPAKFFEYMVSSFYGEDESTRAEMIKHINAAVRNGCAGIVRNVILFAKNEMHMRILPIVSAVHYAETVRNQGITDAQVRSLISSVIVRADELCDTYAYALSVFGSKNKMPLAIKRGIEDAFNKFTEYDLAKYNKGGAVKLSDLLRIVHPTPQIAEMGRVYQQLIEGTLPSPYTWEVEFSKNGQLAKDEQKPKSQIWEEIITNNSLGFLAAIRNVRNMAESGINLLTQEKLSKLISKGSAKVLPFQIFQAYKVTPANMVQVKDALVDASEKAVANVPAVGEAVWIVSDVSGSMNTTVSEKSSMTMLSTAAQLAATMVKSQIMAGKKVAFTAFGTRAKTMQFSKHDTVLKMAEQIEALTSDLGGSTNLDAAFSEYKAVVNLIGEPDTFMVFSDMQVNDRSMFSGEDRWGSYVPVAKIPDYISRIPLKVAMNFNSKDTTPLSKQLGFIQLSGYSEKVFQLLNVLRNYDNIFQRLAV